MAYLGKCDYIGLYNKDAILTQVGSDTFAWKWRVPQSLQARKAPVWFIKLKNFYLDDSDGSSNIPHLLRLKVVSENYHTYEEPSNTGSTNMTNYPILAILGRDAPSGHWSTWVDNPSIQVSSNIQYLEFDILDGNGNVLGVDSTVAGESMNMILQVEYPVVNEVRDNTVMSYVQSQVGNIRI